jgi:glycosyltransferase involved in cell wall biosynthesis
VPQPFGLKGLNLPFFSWLCLRPEPLWIMFHEVVFPFVARQPQRHRLLAVGTRVTLSLLGTRADRSFVSIPGWAPYLERWARTRRAPEWAPVPSNLPLEVRSPRAAIRSRFGMAESDLVLACFGTFSEAIAAALCEAVPRLLGTHPDRRFLLIGKGSQALAQRLGSDSRILPTGAVDEQDAADLLASADLGFFPFIDGASSRRTSLMAALALGLPVVTTEGPLSEPVWRKSEAVGLAAAGDTEGLSKVAERLLDDPAARAKLGQRGRSLYLDRFGVDRALDLLLAESPTTA